ncbi:type IV pilus twitching motility protein PilT [Paenibacillus sp. GSMTC-2017]|uniref:type IV pilus twitching motility protein PilT n=1 Tax=Paenibacillus sp. GSMTC-2017 TaxID=2794350 RepID=UPI0018D99680|nr:type IV pilus twitching motility protein PilT [Paenibacillus sp. GSMTC-2017]MBH5318233.1 type IV pilus twitching motility protein PilT [Paenibacillus sp. GSMTC-2017]
MSVAEILQIAYDMGASDIHITVNSPVLLRIHGSLIPLNSALLNPQHTHNLAKELMTDLQYDSLMEQGEVDFSYGIPKLSRFRVNAYKQRGSVGLAIRIVPSVIPTMEQLQLPLIARDWISKPQGLVLVTGPTGSGKSTTLASMIDHLNRTDNAHVITLEDPIEFIHDHKKSMVNQREVGLDTASFSSGLRAALRQDPDVILVGELRDLDTISTAITAAETGHLVLGTLHTTDAPQTIDRIIDVFPSNMQAQIRIQLASVLLGIMSQRLVPRVDRRGRVAAFEILINSPAVSNLIRSEKVYQVRSVMQTNRSIGMLTMENSLRDLIQKRLISLEAARETLPGLGE